MICSLVYTMGDLREVGWGGVGLWSDWAIDDSEDHMKTMKLSGFLACDSRHLALVLGHRRRTASSVAGVLVFVAGECGWTRADNFNVHASAVNVGSRRVS